MAQIVASSLQLAGEWFSNSGIQDASGGVARYYFTDSKQNARLSTEITGYSISALVYLSRNTGERCYLDAAIRAADFLVDKAWNAQLSIFPFEYSADGALPKHLAYFFDSGIIVRGLLAVWRATCDGRYLQAAIRCGDSMTRDFLCAGTVNPILELPSKAAMPHIGNWSRNPGCYQLKSAMAWRDLYDATGETRFAEPYKRVLAWSLATHRSFLPGADDDTLVMDRLHAYSYFLEGMLPEHGRPECREATREGIDRVAGLLRKIGPVFERCDVAGQLLRARLYAHALGSVPLDRAAAAEEAEIMRGYQREDGNPRIHGGFWFGRKNGKFLPYVNPVSTAFCLQALEMWRQFEAGEFQPDRDELI